MVGFKGLRCGTKVSTNEVDMYTMRDALWLSEQSAWLALGWFVDTGAMNSEASLARYGI